MKTTITFNVDTESLSGFTDEHVAALWHISQANPAPSGDTAACRFAEEVAREIITRWATQQGPALWNHKGSDIGFYKQLEASAARERGAA